MMTAIAPPPVGNELEPSVQRDNEQALHTLRDAVVHERPARPSRSRSRGRSLGALLGFGAATFLAGAMGAAITNRPRNKAWYRMLRKPSFTPPDRVFGLVWPALYTMSAVSGWRVWRRGSSRDRSAALALWGTQLAFNAAWTPIFFGSHRPKLALADLAGNFVSLGAYTYAASRIDGPAAALVAPYLGWLGLAGAMNAGIIAKNRGRFAGLLARG